MIYYNSYPCQQINASIHSRHLVLSGLAAASTARLLGGGLLVVVDLGSLALAAAVTGCGSRVLVGLLDGRRGGSSRDDGGLVLLVVNGPGGVMGHGQSGRYGIVGEWRGKFFGIHFMFLLFDGC